MHTRTRFFYDNVVDGHQRKYRLWSIWNRKRGTL